MVRSRSRRGELSSPSPRGRTWERTSRVCSRSGCTKLTLDISSDYCKNGNGARTVLNYPPPRTSLSIFLPVSRRLVERFVGSAPSDHWHARFEHWVAV